MDSIIFDLDGTLWDSTKALVTPWENTLKENGIDISLTEEDVRSSMGLTVPQIAEKLMPSISKKDRDEIMYKCCDSETPYLLKHGGILYPELEETLKKLSEKYKLFIVSNCEEDYINAFFAFHKLKKYFTDFEYIGRTGLEKSDNIKLVIKRNGLKSPVYVGDTEMDEEAAEKAGIPFIHAAYGFGKPKNKTVSIDKISSLPTILEKIK